MAKMIINFDINEKIHPQENDGNFEFEMSEIVKNVSEEIRRYGKLSGEIKEHDKVIGSWGIA